MNDHDRLKHAFAKTPTPRLRAPRCSVLRAEHDRRRAAPLVDAGRVFSPAATFPFEHLHVAGGMGFRAVIRPQVVA